MAQSFFSSDWYRVAPLKPRLRAHVEIHRQRYRGQTWYIVQDAQSGKFHRLSPAANLIAGLMDGRRTTQELWETACERFPDDPPTQSDTIRLLSQLHSADLIASDLPPDIEELGQRHTRQERQSMLQRIRNPLALRLPLFDPDRFLDATVWLVRWIFTPAGFLLWLALVATGITLAVMHWGELTGGLVDKVLAAENVLLMFFAFPLVKAVHELGHAYATKVWGGEVHEIGTMFLVFIPVPYVDATASAAFPEKRRRAIVGGAGIMVELALASIALIVWLNVEPGLVSAFAFNVMLIGGVSTLLFNGNPLLRFDGYFVLADLIEIPNLGQRSNKYFWYLIQRYGFGIKTAENPVQARGERGWLLFYSIAAFLYRVSISITIALFVASKFFFIGVILAVWALSNVFIFPIFKGLRFLLTAGSLRGRRMRALGLTTVTAVAIAALLFAVPLPHRGIAGGALWLDETAILRAEVEGFVAEALVSEAEVAAGDVLLRMEDPILESETRLAEARLQEMRLRLAAVAGTDAVQARILRTQVEHLEGTVAFYEARAAALTLTAPKAGQAVIPLARDLAGRHLEQGQIIGYIRPEGAPRFLVAVPQDVAELIRASLGVELRLNRDPETAVPARIVAAAPESGTFIPTPALSAEAGGGFALDPSSQDVMRAVEPVFLFEVEAAGPLPPPLIGERVTVRFDYGDAPLAIRMGRAVRQLFLAQFNV